MPMPVSRTVMRMLSGSPGWLAGSKVASRSTLPASVNLMALFSKLISIWLSRVESALIHSGRCSDTRTCRLMFFSWADAASMASIS